MKRRHFLGAGLLGLAAGSAADEVEAFSTSESRSDWDDIYNSNDLETSIYRAKCDAPFAVFQIADSHISCDDETDKEYLPYSKRMGGGVPPVSRHFKTGKTMSRLECFEGLLEKAKEEKADLIALTGDIVNYPSATAVRAVMQRLEKTGIPFLYTAGNHDWHYEGMEGTSTALREEWIEKRLKPLYSGVDPMCSSMIHKGINFVCIDNSTYEIDSRQFDFFREQKQRPEPIVLLMHIPLYMPSLGISSCGHPDWNEQSDPYYKIERRLPWPKEGCSETTKRFVREVWAASRLLGVFTGHIHKPRTICAKDRFQSIAGGALSGQYRLIRFERLETR